MSLVDRDAPPNVVYGRLLEAAHFTSYGFERVCGELEWMLADDRWRSVGPGYDDINEFLASLDLSGLRVTIDQRQRIARKLAELEASQRQTARTLGVGRGTIQRDLSDGPNGPLDAGEPSNDAVSSDEGGPDGSPAPLEAEPPEPPDLFGDDDSVLVELEGEDDRLAARERDARLILLVSKAQAAVAPVTTAQEAIEEMLARLDRDRLDLLAPNLDRAAQTLAALAERSRAIQQRGPRLVSGGRR